MSNVNSRCKSKIRILSLEHKSGNSERNRPKQRCECIRNRIKESNQKCEIAKICVMRNKKIIKRAKEGTLLSQEEKF